MVIVLFWVILLNILINGLCALKFHSNYERIYKGNVAEEGQFPFMVFVLKKKGTRLQLCSGALIEADLVLTAAHCLTTYWDENYIVVAGKADTRQYIVDRLKLPWNLPYLIPNSTLQERRVLIRHIHPEFYFNPYCDVGLIRLWEPFVLSKYVKLIEIDLGPFTPRQNCLKLGYGRMGSILILSATRLMYMETNGIEKDELVCTGAIPLGKHLFCTSNDNSSICVGDSGSPLVCNGKVQGIASQGHYLTDNKSCGAPLIEYYVDIRIENEKPFLMDVIFNFGYKTIHPSIQCALLLILAKVVDNCLYIIISNGC